MLSAQLFPRTPSSSDGFPRFWATMPTLSQRGPQTRGFQLIVCGRQTLVTCGSLDSAQPTDGGAAGTPESGMSGMSTQDTTTTLHSQASSSTDTSKVSATSAQDTTATIPAQASSLKSAISPSSTVCQTPHTASTPSSVESLGSTSISSGTSHGNRLPVPALAGLSVSAVLVTVVAVALVRCWVRRRKARPHARLYTWQGVPTLSTVDHGSEYPSAALLPSRFRSKCQAQDGAPDSCARARSQSVVSSSTCRAQDGSAATPDCVSLLEFRLPAPVLDVERKAGVHREREPSRRALAVSALFPARDLLPLAGSSTEFHGVPEAPPEPETIGASGERVLHLALPWVFGQRVLAIIAREDAHHMDDDYSESLPAYEPRG